jgi:hypothetical protein
VCFSAATNFVGSGVLGTIGMATLTKVKHKRELLFAISFYVVCCAPVHRGLCVASARSGFCRLR